MKPVVVENISKSFSTTKALRDVSLSVEPGEIFGLIGPDGAGKTTLMRILTTLLLPDKGSARVHGFDTVKEYPDIRKIIGYMPGRFSLYMDLSIEENIKFFATVYGFDWDENYAGVKEIYDQIKPFKKRRAADLSGGMKQKLALTCALVHEPEVLFLDEPTTGVDAVSRKEFWQMLKRLQYRGLTIFVSTPYMDEAAQCDRIALIQQGSLLTIDTPQQIQNNYEKPLYAVSGEHKFHLIQDLRSFAWADTVFPFGESIHLTTMEPVPEQSVQDWLTERGHTDIQVKKIAASIEDCFMELMGDE